MHVPKELIERQNGLSCAHWRLAVWPLREWAEDLLYEARLGREGYFHPGPIRQKWAEHLFGARN
jgi:asparagine synthase (glutamine-hydrolysing)